MIRNLALSVLLTLWAGTALAQVVEVRAGEHDSFTRLVFRLPDRLAYTLSQGERRAELGFERSGLVFDTSVVFQRVPRSRLTAIRVTPEDDTVRLSLACDCGIEAFWYGRSALVLDIKDPEPPIAEQEPLDAVTPDVRPSGLRPLPLPRYRSSAATRRVAEALQQMPKGAPAARERSTALRADRAQLLEQLGRAASQGLLTPRRKRPPPARSDAPGAAPEPQPTPRPDKGRREGVPNMNLRAESSVDRATRSATASGSGAATGQRCLDPALVDVTGWAADTPFPQQLGALRTRLLGEFDTPDPAAVTALARLYIHFGFGAEARQVLSQMEETSLAGDVLAAMAAVLEHGHAENGGAILGGQMDCAPQLALWSSLSYPEFPDDQPMNTDAILQGLSALPPHLRAHLGPMLARRFLEGGYRRDSDRVRRILDRSEETATPEADLVSAEITLSRGPSEEAEKTLDKVVEENGEPSAKALLSLIESRLDRGADISYETAQLVGAHAVEQRGHPLGPALARAYRSALAVSGAFDEAFAELEKRSTADTGDMNTHLSDLVGHLTQRADDHDFLRHVTSARVARLGELEPATANKVIRRLLSLGFVAEAARLAAPEAPGAAARDRQLLRAGIALHNGHPRKAELELEALSDKEADLLRARARSRAGDHPAAQEIYAELGRANAAQREAWLGANWPALARDDQTAMSKVARAMLNADKAVREHQEGVLARNRRLLEASDETRETVHAILEAWPAPEARTEP